MLSAFQTKIRNFLKLFPFVKDRFDDKITNSWMEYTIIHLIFPLAVTEIARARSACFIGSPAELISSLYSWGSEVFAVSLILITAGCSPR